VISDVRNFHAHRVMSMGVEATIRYLYPNMIAIHDLSDDVGLPDEATGKILTPWLMPNSYLNMEPHGAYLIGKRFFELNLSDHSLILGTHDIAENGEDLYIWIGDSTSPQIILDLFGVENWDEIGPRTVRP